MGEDVHKDLGHVGFAVLATFVLVSLLQLGQRHHSLHPHSRLLVLHSLEQRILQLLVRVVAVNVRMSARAR